MKSITTAAILLLGTSLVAHASETDFYTRLANSNGDVAEAFQLCQDDWGLVTVDRPATSEFKRCMLQYGWRYDRHATGNASAASGNDYAYINVKKQPRGNQALHVDGNYCDNKVGIVANGAVTLAGYNKCMLGRGWKYKSARHTAPSVKRGHMWWDSELGTMREDTPN